MTGQRHGARPELAVPPLGAPRTDARGGVIYFDTGETRESLLTTFNLMGAGMHDERRDFAIFVTTSSDPQADGFIVHCRIMPFSTLGHLYPAPLDLIAGGTAPQPVSLADVVCGFVQAQEKRWGTGMVANSRRLLPGATATGPRNPCASASWSKTAITASSASGATRG